MIKWPVNKFIDGHWSFRSKYLCLSKLIMLIDSDLSGWQRGTDPSHPKIKVAFFVPLARHRWLPMIWPWQIQSVVKECLYSALLKLCHYWRSCFLIPGYHYDLHVFTNTNTQIHQSGYFFPIASSSQKLNYDFIRLGAKGKQNESMGPSVPQTIPVTRVSMGGG